MKFWLCAEWEGGTGLLVRKVGKVTAAPWSSLSCSPHTDTALSRTVAPHAWNTIEAMDEMADNTPSMLPRTAGWAAGAGWGCGGPAAAGASS